MISHRKKITSGDSLRPTGKPSLFEQQQVNQISQISQKTNNQQKQQGELRKSIVCFRKYLNQSGQSLRNGTIQEQNQQNQTSFQNLPNCDLQLFYQFLECKYDLAEEKLTYFSLLTKMDAQYLKAGQPQRVLTLPIQPPCLGYFVSAWLQSMGFWQQQTRKRITRNINMFLKTRVSITVIEQTYDSLFLQYLPQKLHLSFLLQLCRRGWEYFTFFAVKYLTYIKETYQQETSETEWRKIQSIIHE